MYIDLDTLANQIDVQIARLVTEANTRVYTFPDADFNKSGKPFTRNTVVISLANQAWTAPSNAASLSLGQSIAQETNIDLSFYLFSASLRGTRGIHNQYKILIEDLAGLELEQDGRRLGPLHPINFAFRDLTDNCMWAYELLMSTNLIDGGKRANFSTPIIHG